jgi:hypothetical protein
MISSLRAFTLLPGLHLVEQGVEALEAAFPEPPVALEPSGGFREWPGFEPSRPPRREHGQKHGQLAIGIGLGGAGDDR